MSLEVTCKTNINDRDALVDTLKELVGDNISIVEGGTAVTGYISNLKPEVLVNVTGLIGTAGYYKNAEGNYELVYDSMDHRTLSRIIPKKKGNKLIDPVAQTYAKHKTLKLNKKLKGRIIENEINQDGTIRIKIKVSHY
jgi:hypothetical protein